MTHQKVSNGQVIAGQAQAADLAGTDRGQERTAAEVAEEAAAVRGGHERVLFVDDEPAIARMQKKALERLGYTLETCTDPGDALALFRSRPDAFDLVITDMSMPQIPGDVLANEMIRIRPDIPVILCTGHSSRANGAALERMGIGTLVRKPVEKEEMARLVRRALDGESRIP